MNGGGKTSCASYPMDSFNFFHLPSELQLKILTRLPYDEVSRCRLVCKAMDMASRKLLNAGFHRVERFHAVSLQRVKAQLPRRESERRNHELSRHSDVLTAIETRLSLLSMTYGKYIDSSLCCFIPGKVLDEIFRVLRIVNTMPRGEFAPRPHELLQELRDISSMAMEHFEEHIVPTLRDRIAVSTTSHSRTASLSTGALVLYAAAAAAPPILGFPPIQPTVGDRSFATCIRRKTAASASTVSPAASSINTQLLLQQNYKSLKLQMRSQRSKLSAYRREMTQLRATQVRQKNKIDELEKRLSDHLQYFTDIIAQIRGTNSPGEQGLNNPNTPSAQRKRKRVTPTATEHSSDKTTDNLDSSKLSTECSAKRPKK